MSLTSHFNLYEYFLSDERLARIGRSTAIEFRGRSFTYEQLRQEVDYWAAELLSHGIGPGDRVLMLLHDSPELIACFLACAAIGAIAVPVNTFLSPDDVDLIIRDSDARLIVVEAVLLEKATAEAVRGRTVINMDSEGRPCLSEEKQTAPCPTVANTGEASPAFILYTSGSTGRPKGVLHRQGAIPATVDSYARTVLGLRETDRTYSASRMFFAYGLGNSLSFPLAAGATTILHTERVTPEYVAHLLRAQRPTVFFGVPALFAALTQLHRDDDDDAVTPEASRPGPGSKVDGLTQLEADDPSTLEACGPIGGSKAEGLAQLEHDHDTGTLEACGPRKVDGLRMCVSAGEALPGKIFEDWRRQTGLSILDGIGSTEMLHIFISNHPGDAKPDCTGKPVDGYQTRLLDEEGNPVGPDHTGSLWVGGPSATSGYWNMPELTSQVINDGWVKTGDLYRRDPDGYFYQLGRSDDCFKVKGLWVSPVEVESVLFSHESVAEVAVVPDFDATGLATAHAFVVIPEEGDRARAAETLLNYAAARLPGHKVPSQIDLVEALPRTATGKVQRFKLRQQPDSMPKG